MSKDEFKIFAKKHPSLIKYVNNNTMTWQKFYDMYELYGSDHEIWNEYLESNKDKKNVNNESIRELINTFKDINLEKVQKGIDSIQKTISLIQDLGVGNSSNMQAYERMPSYERFED